MPVVSLLQELVEQPDRVLVVLGIDPILPDPLRLIEVVHVSLRVPVRHGDIVFEGAQEGLEGVVPHDAHAVGHFAVERLAQLFQVIERQVEPALRQRRQFDSQLVDQVLVEQVDESAHANQVGQAGKVAVLVAERLQQ